MVTSATKLRTVRKFAAVVDTTASNVKLQVSNFVAVVTPASHLDTGNIAV
jgi:hypothetical protein